ncbi:hypothetical protein BTIS_1432 [Bifidobacterium tissieri]|uniref:Uncharacterized protein n=1 Tax=Bifidobacterium tissieri TaxID=1630162 RepID=A0A261FE15_9BIFI|nr:hypothetical protein [Bifidobacterium tissieri]OZG57338.1 hypothetical protein BTIS_1432 [Bifidobacterium tissieri]
MTSRTTMPRIPALPTVRRRDDERIETPGSSASPKTAADLADARRSRIAILRALPAGQRWRYFRDQLLARALAGIAIIATVVFLTVHMLTPAPAPALYVAVIDGAIDPTKASSLQSEAAQAMGLPEGRESGIVVDAYFDLGKDGLSKLQTMLGNGEIDVIIADHDDFATLAGYGYMTDLDHTLTGEQRAALAADIVTFPGFDDRDTDDPDYNGSGRGASEPFGAKIDGLAQWASITGPTTNPNTDTYVGLAQESGNLATAQRFIDYLRG